MNGYGWILCGLVLAMSVGGCVTEERPHNLAGLFDDTSSWAEPGQAGQPLRLKADQSTLGIDDPCVENLEALEAALLMYYQRHSVMPDNLSDLSLPAARLRCPVSGSPYEYWRQGYQAEGVYDRLLVYDAKPAHNGVRYAVVMEPIEPNHALKLFVIPLKQNLLDYYLQATQRLEQKPFIAPH